MTEPLLINACLTGMVPMKDRCPDLPVTPAEIVADALEAQRLGASIVHIHARGGDQQPTWDPGVYREIFTELRRAAPALILCASTSGRLWNEREKRAAVLLLESDARPDMASLTLGSLNFPKSVSANSIDDIDYLLDVMRAQEVRPELEVFDLGMADYLGVLMRRRTMPEPLYVNVLLGNLATAAADESNLCYLVSRLPRGTIWAGAGIGRAQQPVAEWSIRMGGHVRIGLEDNIYADHERRIPTSNRALVGAVVAWGGQAGRAPMRAEAARHLLQLPESACRGS